MGELIVFYVPENFKSSATKWMPPSERGKLIEFQAQVKKSA